MFVDLMQKYKQVMEGKLRDYLGTYLWGVAMATQAAYLVKQRDFYEASRIFNDSYSKFTEASLIQPTWTPIQSTWAYTLRLQAGFENSSLNKPQVATASVTRLRDSICLGSRNSVW